MGEHWQKLGKLPKTKPALTTKTADAAAAFFL